MRYDSSSAIKRHRARPKIALDSNYRPFCSTVRGGGDVSQFAIPGPDVIVSCGLGPGVPLPKPHSRSCSNVKLKSVPKQVGVSEGRDVKLSIKSTYCFSCRGQPTPAPREPPSRLLYKFFLPTHPIQMTSLGGRAFTELRLWWKKETAAPEVRSLRKTRGGGTDRSAWSVDLALLISRLRFGLECVEGVLQRPAGRFLKKNSSGVVGHCHFLGMMTEVKMSTGGLAC